MRRDDPAGLAAGASAERHVYAAALGERLFGLDLAAAGASGAGRHTLDAAMALGRAEVCLPVFEAWLGTGLVPAPLHDAGPHTFERHVRLHHEALDIAVRLPLAVLRTLGPPPAALAPWRWQPLACTLVLDALPLEAGMHDELQPGAVLLLPASFSNQWAARLQLQMAPEVVVAALISPSDARLRLAGTNPACTPLPAGDVQVRLEAALQVPLSVLLAWPHEELPLDIGAIGAAGVGIHEPAGRGIDDGRRLGSGRIFPLAEGFGVQIDAAPLSGACAADAVPAGESLVPA